MSSQYIYYWDLPIMFHMFTYFNITFNLSEFILFQRNFSTVFPIQGYI